MRQRIVGELKGLDIAVSATYVRNVLRAGDVVSVPFIGKFADVTTTQPLIAILNELQFT